MSIRCVRFWLSAVAVASLPSSLSAALLTPMASFGGGDGWRAPNEIVAGDLAGTATGSNYNYLQANGLERGLAYNPTTGHLILVSNSAAGDGLRILNGTTGADIGSLNQGAGVISGGAFATNSVAAADDGAIYVSNLETNVGANSFKIYRWSDEGAATPVTYLNATVPGFTGTPRLGDSLDVVGSGVQTRLAAGAGGAGLEGAQGYAIVTSSGATAVANFTPTTPAPDGYSTGITFAESVDHVWGKTFNESLELSSYSDSNGVRLDSINLGQPHATMIDYAVVNGAPLLATLDFASSEVRVYSFAKKFGNMYEPELIASAVAASGILPVNPNGTGSIRFGEIGATGAVIYALSTNQGIQAFELTGVVIPEPSGALLGSSCAAILASLWRSRHGALNRRPC